MMYIIQMHNSTESQMMGYFLITDNKKVIAVDGGTRGDSEEFLRLIHEYGRNHINLWILTHPHSDHVGVFWDVLEKKRKIEVDMICYSPAGKGFVAKEKEARTDLEYFNQSIRNCMYPLHIIRTGERFKLDNLTIEILRTANPEIKCDWVNNLSVVFRVTEQLRNEKYFSMIFLGDLGEEGGEELLRMYGKKEGLYGLKADAVQMAHHGQDGVKNEVYWAIHPKWAFWPTPDWLWSNTPRGEAQGTGPWKTLQVRAEMEKMGTHFINSFEKNTIFKTKEI